MLAYFEAVAPVYLVESAFAFEQGHHTANVVDIILNFHTIVHRSVGLRSERHFPPAENGESQHNMVRGDIESLFADGGIAQRDAVVASC